jgi:pilus assembly protein CpaB
MRNKFLIIGVGLVVLFVVFSGALYLKNKDIQPKGTVVVAIQTIPELSPVLPDMVKVIEEIPEKLIPPNAIRSLDELEGLWTMAGYGVPKNSYLFRDILVTEDALLKAWVSEAEEGERFVSITVDLPSSLGGKISRGDVVELWFSFKGTQKIPAYAGRLLDQVEVVSIQNTQGQDILRSVTTASASDDQNAINSLLSTSLNGSGGNLTPRLLTIKVPEEMVKYVLMSQNIGKLLVVGKQATEADSPPVVGEAKVWLDSYMAQQNPKKEES